MVVSNNINRGQIFSFKSCQLIGAPANYSPPRSNMPPGVPKARHIVACANLPLCGWARRAQPQSGVFACVNRWGNSESQQNYTLICGICKGFKIIFVQSFIFCVRGFKIQVVQIFTKTLSKQDFQRSALIGPNFCESHARPIRWLALDENEYIHLEK